jgi:hypothetical protein
VPAGEAKAAGRRRSIPIVTPLAAIAAATAASAITATTSASTSTVVTAPASSTAPAIPTTTGRPVLAGTRFIHRERATFERFAVELRNRILRIGIRGHRDKREPARLARELILNELHFGDGSGLREVILKIDLGRGEWQIAHVEFITHET